MIAHKVVKAGKDGKGRGKRSWSRSRGNRGGQVREPSADGRKGAGKGDSKGKPTWNGKEVCTFHLEGRCNRHDACTYQHVESSKTRQRLRKEFGLEFKSPQNGTSNALDCSTVTGACEDWAQFWQPRDSAQTTLPVGGSGRLLAPSLHRSLGPVVGTVDCDRPSVPTWFDRCARQPSGTLVRDSAVLDWLSSLDWAPSHYSACMLTHSPAEPGLPSASCGSGHATGAGYVDQPSGLVAPMGHGLRPYYHPEVSAPEVSSDSPGAPPPGLGHCAGQSMANQRAAPKVPVVKRLSDLPSAAWAGEEKCVKWGYNAQTRAFILDVGYPTLVDSGATNSTSPEELICYVITDAFTKGHRPGDAAWPVRNLRWIRNESIGGIKKSAAVQIVAQCELELEFTPLASKSGPRQWVSVIVFGSGQSDYPGIILGLPTLDVSPYGLGWRPTERCHVFDSLSVMLPREEIRHRSEPSASRQVVAFSPNSERAFSSGELAVVGLHRTGGAGVFRSPIAHPAGEPLGYALLATDEVVLQPGHLGVIQVTWDIVSNAGVSNMHVTGSGSSSLIVGEGTWPWDLCGLEGKIPVFNGDVHSLRFERGDTIAVGIAPQELEDSEVDSESDIERPPHPAPGWCPLLEVEPLDNLLATWAAEAKRKGKSRCGPIDLSLLPSGLAAVGGIVVQDVLVLHRPKIFPTARDALIYRRVYLGLADGAWLEPANLLEHDQQALVEASVDADFVFAQYGARPLWAVVVLYREAPRVEVGTAFRMERTVAQAPSVSGCAGRLRPGVFHIKEETEVIKQIHDGLPPPEYYDALAAHLQSKFPHASELAAEHLSSVEQLVDIAIMFGISFSASKLQLLRQFVKLLGEILHRGGRSPDPEKCDALRHWPPVTNLKQLQEFMGFLNFIAKHAGPNFHTAMSALRPWLKPATPWPWSKEAQSAFECLKTIVCAGHVLHKFDEAAARRGDRPAEQIVDVSGTAIGGVLVQMNEEFTAFNPVAYYSEALDAAKQVWHASKQELYGQKKAKIAFRRCIGSSPEWAWTDHANLTRLAYMPLDRIDPLMFRYFAELTGDGTKLQALSGRSQLLVAADAISRNHKDRDALLAMRSEDLEGMKRRIREFRVEDYHEGDLDPVPHDVVCIKAFLPPHHDNRHVLSIGGDIGDCRLLYLPAYERSPRVEHRAKDLARLLRDMLGQSLDLRVCLPSFYDPLPDAGYWISPWARRDSETKKRYRNHIFVGIITVLRACVRTRPCVIMASGQGALVLAALSRPEVVERALATKVIHPPELAMFRDAWADLKLFVLHDIQATRGHSDINLLNVCVPEFSMDQYREVPTAALLSKGPHRDFAFAVCRQIGALTSTNDFADLNLRVMFKTRPLTLYGASDAPCAHCRKPAGLGRCLVCKLPLHLTCGRLTNPCEGLMCPDCRSAQIVSVKGMPVSDSEYVDVCCACDNQAVPDFGLSRCTQCSARLCAGCVDHLSGLCPDCFESVSGEELVAVMAPGVPAGDCARWARVRAPQTVVERRVFSTSKADSDRTARSAAGDALMRSFAREWADEVVPGKLAFPPWPGADGTAPISDTRMFLYEAQRADPETSAIFDRLAGGRSLDKLAKDAKRRTLNEARHYVIDPYDGVLLRQVSLPVAAIDVPVIPRGTVPFLPKGHVLTWRRWIFDCYHVELEGGHRPADKTCALIRRTAYWDSIGKDVTAWWLACEICRRMRGTTRPQGTIRKFYEEHRRAAYQRVMMDVLGPVLPADRDGNRYVLVWMCCDTHNVCLKVSPSLQKGPFLVRVLDCCFSVGTFATDVFCDRGPEMRNAVQEELRTVLGIRSHSGAPLTPRDHGLVERAILAVQQELMIILNAVIKGFPQEWGLCIPAVMYLLNGTPIQDTGITPRDLDKIWSGGTSVERDLNVFHTPTEDLSSDLLKETFRRYQELRSIVDRALTDVSTRRAEQEDRKRRPRDLQPGDIVYRKFPKAAKRLGDGFLLPAAERTPYIVYRLLSDFKVVLSDLSGNLLENGEGVPIEQLILRPDPSFDSGDLLPRDELSFEDGGPRSLGDALRDASVVDHPHVDSKPSRALAARLRQVGPGGYVAYDVSAPQSARTARVGLILSNQQSAQELTVQRMRSAQHYVRVLWRPLYLDTNREEIVLPPFLPDQIAAVPNPSNCRPVTELCAYKRVLELVNLFQDGSLNHSGLRALEDKKSALEVDSRLGATRLCRGLASVGRQFPALLARAVCAPQVRFAPPSGSLLKFGGAQADVYGNRDAVTPVAAEVPVSVTTLKSSVYLVDVHAGIAVNDQGDVIPVHDSARRRRQILAGLRVESAATQATAPEHGPSEWMSKAHAGDFDSVTAPVDVYVKDENGHAPESDPRRSEAYRQQVLDAVGLGSELSDDYKHLNVADIAMCRDVVSRKAAAFWIEGGPRTTVRGFLHHLIVKGGPIRLPPHRVKGDDLKFVEESLQTDLRRGQLTRGRSEWGAPAFPTKPGKRKRRVVIDYRKLNSITEKASFLIPYADDIKEQMSAAWWYTAADAVSGFNHVRNTPEARMILAIVSASGTWLPEALVFGPTNGPEDFQYVVYRAFGESCDVYGRRRLLSDWQIYIDDFAIATRRPTAGERADQGLSAAAGSGCFPSPIAHKAISTRCQTAGERAEIGLSVSSGSGCFPSPIAHAVRVSEARPSLCLSSLAFAGASSSSQASRVPRQLQPTAMAPCDDRDVGYVSREVAFIGTLLVSTVSSRDDLESVRAVLSSEVWTQFNQLVDTAARRGEVIMEETIERCSKLAGAASEQSCLAAPSDVLTDHNPYFLSAEESACAVSRHLMPSARPSSRGTTELERAVAPRSKPMPAKAVAPIAPRSRPTSAPKMLRPSEIPAKQRSIRSPGPAVQAPTLMESKPKASCWPSGTSGRNVPPKVVPTSAPGRRQIATKAVAIPVQEPKASEAAAQGEPGLPPQAAEPSSAQVEENIGLEDLPGFQWLPSAEKETLAPPGGSVLTPSLASVPGGVHLLDLPRIVAGDPTVERVYYCGATSRLGEDPLAIDVAKEIKARVLAALRVASAPQGEALSELFSISFNAFGHFKPLLRALARVEETTGTGPPVENVVVQPTKSGRRELQESSESHSKREWRERRLEKKCKRLYEGNSKKGITTVAEQSLWIATRRPKDLPWMRILSKEVTKLLQDTAAGHDAAAALAQEKLALLNVHCPLRYRMVSVELRCSHSDLKQLGLIPCGPSDVAQGVRSIAVRGAFTPKRTHTGPTDIASYPAEPGVLRASIGNKVHVFRVTLISAHKGLVVHGPVGVGKYSCEIEDVDFTDADLSNEINISEKDLENLRRSNKGFSEAVSKLRRGGPALERELIAAKRQHTVGAGQVLRRRAKSSVRLESFLAKKRSQGTFAGAVLPSYSSLSKSRSLVTLRGAKRMGVWGRTRQGTKEAHEDIEGREVDTNVTALQRSNLEVAHARELERRKKCRVRKRLSESDALEAASPVPQPSKRAHKTTTGELAAAGRSRASGPGVFPSPIAHFTAVRASVAICVALVTWPVLRVYRAASDSASDTVAAAGAGLVDATEAVSTQAQSTIAHAGALTRIALSVLTLVQVVQLCGLTSVGLRLQHQLLAWTPRSLREHQYFRRFFQLQLPAQNADAGLAVLALELSRAREGALRDEVRALRRQTELLATDLHRSNELVARLTSALEGARR